MKTKKLLVFSLLVLITFPLLSKKKKESIQTFIEKTQKKEKKISLLEIVKKDRILALNYIKVRERILKNSKKRKFHMIFRASIKHILEDKKENYTDIRFSQTFQKPKSIKLKLNNRSDFSSLFVNFLVLDKKFIRNNLGVLNIRNSKGFNENYLSLSSKINIGSLSFVFNGLKNLNYIERQFYYNSTLSLNNPKFNAKFSIWEGFGDIVKGRLMFYGDEYPFQGESFSFEKIINNYSMELSQNIFYLNSYNLNSFSLNFKIKRNFVETSVGGGYILAYQGNKSLKDYYYLNLFVKKRFLNQTFVFNLPYIFSNEDGYLRFLSYNYSPSFKFFTFITPLSSEFFVGVYYNVFNKDNRFLYQVGFIKNYNL